MILILDKTTTVNQLMDGSVAVTRPCLIGPITTHIIRSPYSALDIAEWLQRRLDHKPNMMVQVAFPKMSEEDREFLMTGITPDHWNRIFKEDKEEPE